MNKRNKGRCFGERIVGNMQYIIDLLCKFFQINIRAVRENEQHIPG